MPSVFLSYDRDDLKIVQHITNGLEEQRVSVWRDQERLRAGQKWPKALGDAIAKQDFFLLVWSEHAAESDFVEFEWTIAIALKKTIIPYRLDATALPASLSAHQAIDGRDSAIAVTSILEAIKIEPSRDDVDVDAVLRKLDAINSKSDKQVVQSARAIAGAQGPLEKWRTWIALIVGILTVLSLVAIYFFSNTDQMLEQALAGQVVEVVDADNIEPLADVQVSLLGFARETTTDRNGYFSFEKVRAAKQERVKFTLRKACYRVVTYDATLGNTELRPPLNKSGECK
jgi:hypothetical protein